MLGTVLTILLTHATCCVSRPGDRVQVTDDSNEDWWKVSIKEISLSNKLSLIRFPSFIEPTCEQIKYYYKVNFKYTALGGFF